MYKEYNINIKGLLPTNILNRYQPEVKKNEHWFNIYTSYKDKYKCI